MMDRCYMCKRNGESVDYSLLHYNVASTIWSVFFFFFFSVFLGFPWLCLDVLLICITAGGFLAGQGVLRCGK